MGRCGDRCDAATVCLLVHLIFIFPLFVSSCVAADVLNRVEQRTYLANVTGDANRVTEGLSVFTSVISILYCLGSLLSLLRKAARPAMVAMVVAGAILDVFLLATMSSAANDLRIVNAKSESIVDNVKAHASWGAIVAFGFLAMITQTAFVVLVVKRRLNAQPQRTSLSEA